MIRRILSAGFGGLLFAVLTPLTALLLDLAPAQLPGLIWLACLGAIVGLCLGVLFPKVFGFVFEALFEASE